MAKARRFVIKMHAGEILDDETIIATGETRAWNSAITKSEAMVRDFARETGEQYKGDAPVVTGRPGTQGSVYQRRWVGTKTGSVLRVYFYEVVAN